MKTNAIVGGLGEDIARKFLIKNKYKILHTNYKTKLGEIDIVCFDKKTDTYVFVEVKYRSTKIFGYPREAVDSRKQNKIKMVATEYMRSNRIYNKKARFDVVEILDEDITHIKNAF